MSKGKIYCALDIEIYSLITKPNKNFKLFLSFNNAI